MSDFKELKVWRKSHALALECSPDDNSNAGAGFGLVAQPDASGGDVDPGEHCGGCGQQTKPQFVRFLQISLGSTSELEYHLIVARDIAVINKSDYESLRAQLIEIRRMLYALVRKLNDVKSGAVGTPS